MIASSEKILKLVKEENLIENFSPECLGGVGYDLRIGRIYKIKSPGFIGNETQINSEAEEIEFLEYYTLKPDEYVLIETLEIVNMPKGIAARILPRPACSALGALL